MAMQRQTWSVNALSVELGVDRRRLSRLLEETKPAAIGPCGPTYYMADAVHKLVGPVWTYTEADRLDHAGSSWLDHVTGDDEAEDRLAPLVAALARAKTPDRCERLLREFLASRLWAWLRLAGSPTEPAWSQLDDATLRRCYAELAAGATLIEVAGIADGGDSDA